MSYDMIQKIQSKWEKLNRTQLQNMQGTLDGVVDMLQSSYGYPRSRAEREFHDFQISLRPVPIRPKRAY